MASNGDRHADEVNRCPNGLTWCRGPQADPIPGSAWDGMCVPCRKESDNV